MDTAEPTGRAKGYANLRPWQPGQSGNPGGQNKTLVGYVKDKIGKDGRKAVDYMFEVLENVREPTARRMEAADWLVVRGFGRPIQQVQAAVVQVPRLLEDLRSMSREQLLAIADGQAEVGDVLELPPPDAQEPV